MSEFEQVSQEEAIQRWNESTEKFANIFNIPPDPFDRQAPSWYDLTDWVIRVNNGFVVGMAGWSDFGDFALLGGLKAIGKEHPSGLGGGNAGALLDYRKNLLGSKPKVAGLKSSKMPQAQWVNWNREKGYEINPQEHSIPEGLVEKLKERYGNDWGILKHVNWWSTIKNDPEWLL